MKKSRIPNKYLYQNNFIVIFEVLKIFVIIIFVIYLLKCKKCRLVKYFYCNYKDQI